MIPLEDGDTRNMAEQASDVLYLNQEQVLSMAVSRALRAQSVQEGISAFSPRAGLGWHFCFFLQPQSALLYSVQVQVHSQDVRFFLPGSGKGVSIRSP